MYRIVECMLFNHFFHGMTENSSPSIEGHFIINRMYDLVYEGFERTYIDTTYISDNDYYGENMDTDNSDEEIDYLNNMNDLEIVEVRILPHGSEYIAIKKTFWIRILQRTIRNRYKLLRTIKRNFVPKLFKRQIYGKHIMQMEI